MCEGVGVCEGVCVCVSVCVCVYMYLIYDYDVSPTRTFHSHQFNDVLLMWTILDNHIFYQPTERDSPIW